MNTMLKTMVENYKALMDEHKRAYEKGCYESVEEFRGVIKEEYHDMLGALQGIARYDAISWEELSELSNECLRYALDIGCALNMLI